MQRLNQESLRFKANPVEDQVEDGWQQIMKMMNKYGEKWNEALLIKLWIWMVLAILDI